MTSYAPRSIDDLARELALDPSDLEPYGRDKAKVRLRALDRATPKRAGRLVLVSAITPTAAGEGKTTMSIALAMGMRRLDKHAVLALREPSLGPVFGVKGGGTGGGKASLVPADSINLHFTGDIHAITAANNLLAAMVDNAIHHRETELDPRQITWNRALDVNDRALRRCIVGLGGKVDGVPREARFDITAASEAMAVLALSTDYADLEARLARIVVGRTYAGKAVTAGDLGAAGAMTALLRDALLPNLVQTAEGGPAFVHAGPFGNIAHGCNSVLATRLAMQCGDYAITEAGFGFDLGGEKFLDIKCRAAGMWPRAVVLVTTLRALKVHGGVPAKQAAGPDEGALRAGLTHLDKQIENVRAFGLEPIVAVNVFPQDVEPEIELVLQAARERSVRGARCDGFARGGEGATELARVVCEVVDATDAAPPAPRYLYELADPPIEKLRKVARTIYGARDVVVAAVAERDLARAADLGFGAAPVCVAKTQLSLSDDPALVGRPRDFTVTVREVRVDAGAGFLVTLMGEMSTMPGLPKVPAARGVRLLPDGTIKGLMQND